MRFTAFLTALFETIHKVIDKPGTIQKRITDSTLTQGEKKAALTNFPLSFPEKFRLLMTVGQQFTEQGSPHVKFYDEVIERADEASFLLYPGPVRLSCISCFTVDFRDLRLPESRNRQILRFRSIRKVSLFIPSQHTLTNATQRFGLLLSSNE